MTDLDIQAIPSHALSALRSRYAEPWRRYHAMAHPYVMLDHLRCATADGVYLDDPDAAVAFCFWHDAVYDPQAARGRNETLSAELLVAEAPFPAPSLDAARLAILATIDHRVPGQGCPDAPLLLDVDLSILGASEPSYRRYADDIRFEYGHVDDDAYRAGRAGVLRSFLDRERIYLTDWAWSRWEGTARANLLQELDTLVG